MNLNEREQAIKEKLDAYVAAKPFRYHPDEAVVERVIRGLAKREEKSGAAYCPCRLTSGDPEKDKAIVCPCAHHEEEIRQQGFCHCRLFVSEDFEGEN